jgi:hypothetical protein
MRVVLLNGPPRSGKDTLGEMLVQALPRCVVQKFAQPIIDYMFKIHGIRMSDVAKDEPHPNLAGRTPREVAIHYSERMCKPMFGQDYFGRWAAWALTKIPKGIETVVFTDSGFAVEASQIVRVAEHVTLVRLHRRGCTFNGDSRSYWPAWPSMPEIEFWNDAEDLKALKDKVKADLVPDLRKLWGDL